MSRGTGKTGLTERGDKTLADRAYEVIEEMIVTRELPPAAMISEAQLGERLKIGRSPIREAIARLEYIGFLEVHARRGILVSSVDIIGHLELLEVRRPLEETVVRHAIGRGTDQQQKDIVSVARELAIAAKEGDRTKYFRHKRKLHETEVAAANNAALTRTMKSLHAQSRRFWHTYEPTESFVEGARLHAHIAAAISKRDTSVAVKAVGELFEFLERLTRNALDRRPRD